MTKPRPSWMYRPEPDLSIAECEARIDEWCRARPGRTAVYSIDSSQRPTEYAVWLDTHKETVIEAVGTDKRKVWNKAAEAIK